MIVLLNNKRSIDYLQLSFIVIYLKVIGNLKDTSINVAMSHTIRLPYFVIIS